MTTSFEQQIINWEAQCGGIVGFSATHLPSMKTISHNETRKFLLCSTYKIPIAICLLEKILHRELSFEQMITIHDYDIRPGFGLTLHSFDYSTSVSISLKNVLKLMLQESCNTSTDIILKLVGGADAVMKTLKNHFITDLQVNRNTLEILSAWHGIRNLIPENQKCTLEEYQAFEKQKSSEEVLAAHKLFLEQPYDRGTPEAMTNLLIKLLNYEILNQEYTELLFKIMRRCKTGPKRIMGLLPLNTQVAHKTGTLHGFINDVGVIYPCYSTQEFKEKIALSIFVETTQPTSDINERVISEIARSVYDYFMFFKS